MGTWHTFELTFTPSNKGLTEDDIRLDPLFHVELDNVGLGVEIQAPGDKVFVCLSYNDSSSYSSLENRTLLAKKIYMKYAEKNSSGSNEPSVGLMTDKCEDEDEGNQSIISRSKKALLSAVSEKLKEEIDDLSKKLKNVNKDIVSLHKHEGLGGLFEYTLP